MNKKVRCVVCGQESSDYERFDLFPQEVIETKNKYGFDHGYLKDRDACSDCLKNVPVCLKQQNLKIKKDDTVSIKAYGCVISGKVISAEHNDVNGWYIELRTDYGGYNYYKQLYDGGKVVQVNGVDV